MNPQVRAFVQDRAGNRCEYCQRRQEHSPLMRLQIEHVIPLKHGGTDHPSNLALACSECNLHKGSNLAGLDPESGTLTPLFNPRVEEWNIHFIWNEFRIIGITAVGRTTVQVLNLNSPPRIRIRKVTM